MADVNIDGITLASALSEADRMEVQQTTNGSRRGTLAMLAQALRAKALPVTGSWTKPLSAIFRVKATGTGTLRLTGRKSDGVTTEVLDDMAVVTSGIDFFDMNESVEVQYSVLSGSFSAVEIF
jgi:hypothetical protein